jgi:hypothetical protein
VFTWSRQVVCFHLSVLETVLKLLRQKWCFQTFSLRHSVNIVLYCPRTTISTCMVTVPSGIQHHPVSNTSLATLDIFKFGWPLNAVWPVLYIYKHCFYFRNFTYVTIISQDTMQNLLSLRKLVLVNLVQFLNA